MRHRRDLLFWRSRSLNAASQRRVCERTLCSGQPPWYNQDILLMTTLPGWVLISFVIVCSRERAGKPTNRPLDLRVCFNRSPAVHFAPVCHPKTKRTSGTDPSLKNGADLEMLEFPGWKLRRPRRAGREKSRAAKLLLVNLGRKLSAFSPASGCSKSISLMDCPLRMGASGCLLSLGVRLKLAENWKEISRSH